MIKDENYYNSLDKRSKEYKQWKLSKETFTENVGLGDVVDSITTKTGIKAVVKAITKDCGCDERKKKWNETSLFKKGLKPRCFTDEEEQEYKHFMDTRTLNILNPTKAKGTIDNKQRLFVCKLYADVFNRPYFNPCVNCSQSPLINMVYNLDKVYENI